MATTTPNLESFCYGDEDHQQVEKFLSLSPRELKDLSWNSRFRLWMLHLKHKGAEKRDEYTQQNNLSDILLGLKAETMKLSPVEVNVDVKSALDLIDLPQTDENGQRSCWQTDCLLRYWTRHQRHLFIKDLEQYGSNRILVADQVCLIEILEIIDQVTGYNGLSSQSAGRDISPPQAKELPEFVATGNTGATMPEELVKWFSPRHGSGDAPDVDFGLPDLYNKLGNEGIRGSTFLRLSRSIVDFPEASHSWLQRQIASISFVGQNDDAQLIRGKSLLLYLLMEAGVGTTGGFQIDSTRYNRGPGDTLAFAIDSLGSLPEAVNNYLLRLPTQHGIAPDVKALTNRLWDLAVQPSSNGAVLKVAKQFRDWLPLNSLLPRFRSLLAASLSVSQQSPLQGDPEKYQLLQDLTALAVLGCEGGRDLLLDEEIVHDNMLPLVFNHVLSVSNSRASKGLKTNKDNAINAAMASFTGFMDVLIEHSDLLATLPEMTTLIRIATAIDLPDESPTKGDDLKVNCLTLRHIHNRLPAESRQALKLPHLCSAFIRFCQEQEHAMCPKFGEIVMQWFEWDEEKMSIIWISSICRELMTQEGDLMTSIFLQDIHACATVKHACSKPRRCWIEMFLGTMESYELAGRKHHTLLEVENRILYMTPHQHFFQGARRPLEAIFAEILGVFPDLRDSLAGIKRIMTAVAMHLRRTLNPNDETESAENSESLARCAGLARQYLQRANRGPNGTWFVSWQLEVSHGLRSLEAGLGPGGEWWKKVSLDLMADCASHHETLATCSPGKIPDKRSDSAPLINTPLARKRAASHAQRSSLLIGVSRMHPPRRRQRLGDDSRSIDTTPKVSKEQQNFQLTESMNNAEETDLQAPAQEEEGKGSDESEGSDDEVLLLDF